ncbi:MAG: thiamine-phosphate kinase [Candidatus Thermoplasmatota archaeon]|nr:thiamine-phosphate kinase [Candidatus Thermoplasmatota archaeon]
MTVGLWVNVKLLADLGERMAIQRIAEVLTKGTASSGIGDDCAAIDMGKEYLLVTTDMMYQQTHIPVQMTPFQMGWFLVAINLSDIAAKGGTPLGLVLSFGLPKETSEVFLTQLASGADACAVANGTTIVGGDTKETAEITLCGSAFGTVKKDEFMSRVGTCPGDVVAVTGTLGKAGAGYYALKRHVAENVLSKALLEPTPNLRQGRVLAQQKVITSSMDLSDGLSASLYQLQELNNVGFEIKKSAVPLALQSFELLEKNYRFDPYELALHFGGDYELLVTLPAGRFDAVHNVMAQHGFELTAIGKVTRKKDILLLDGKGKQVLENKGYEHFKKRNF